MLHNFRVCRVWLCITLCTIASLSSLWLTACLTVTPPPAPSIAVSCCQSMTRPKRQRTACSSPSWASWPSAVQGAFLSVRDRASSHHIFLCCSLSMARVVVWLCWHLGRHAVVDAAETRSGHQLPPPYPSQESTEDAAGYIRN
jgi:hypothetical protein